MTPHPLHHSEWGSIFTYARALERRGLDWRSAYKLHRRDLAVLANQLPWGVR